MSENQPPKLPLDDLKSALGEHPEGHAALDDLHAAMNDTAPRIVHVHAAVDRLRAIPEIEARVANWFDSPDVQRWIYALSETGL